MIYYTLKHVLNELRKEGFIVTRVWYNHKEQDGKLPKPKDNLLLRETPAFGTYSARIFSKQEKDKLKKRIKDLILKG